MIMIDFEALNRVALTDLPTLLPRWVPDGRGVYYRRETVLKWIAEREDAL